MGKYIEWREIDAHVEFGSGRHLVTTLNPAVDYNDGLDASLEVSLDAAAEQLGIRVSDWTKINLTIGRGVKLSYEDLARAWSAAGGCPETLKHIEWSDDSETAQEEGH